MKNDVTAKTGGAPIESKGGTSVSGVVATRKAQAAEARKRREAEAASGALSPMDVPGVPSPDLDVNDPSFNPISLDDASSLGADTLAPTPDDVPALPTTPDTVIPKTGVSVKDVLAARAGGTDRVSVKDMLAQRISPTGSPKSATELIASRTAGNVQMSPSQLVAARRFGKLRK